jgi:hypothetical protein
MHLGRDMSRLGHGLLVGLKQASTYHAARTDPRMDPARGASAHLETTDTWIELDGHAGPDALFG